VYEIQSYKMRSVGYDRPQVQNAATKPLILSNMDFMVISFSIIALVLLLVYRSKCLTSKNPVTFENPCSNLRPSFLDAENCLF